MVGLLKSDSVKNARVLMLQGPVGPFFAYLANDLRIAGATVFKINFHGGDWLFYPTKCVNFRKPLEEWPAFLEQFLIRNQIDLILLFGDCRPIHLDARFVASKLGVRVGVFEEGYIRPDFITLEVLGVNANSTLSKDPNFYKRIKAQSSDVQHVGNPFFYAMVWAMLYNSAASLLKPVFLNYRHHRNLSIFDGICWLKSFWRKQIYRESEKGIQEFLIKNHRDNFFIVPLQVGNDAQIHAHSRFNNNHEFIEEVMESFAKFAPPEMLLVIKQHPLERGYSNHSDFIEMKARRLNIFERVLYIHDQHLPTLLTNARGCVVINSTVGLSAIHHNILVKSLGEAIYDIPSLTFQGTLDDFWKSTDKPDLGLYRAFKSHIVDRTQINGNYYRRMPVMHLESGILWT